MKFHALLRTATWAGFLFSLHTALTVYVNSSFLETKIPSDLVGILYTAAAIVSIAGLYVVPRLINKFGSSKVLGGLMVLNIGNLIGLIISPNAAIIAICFILFISFNTLIYLGLDILIEHWSVDAPQGTVRGKYLTLLSIGFMTAPLIAGFIADRLGFSVLYGFSLIMIIPVFAIAVLQLPAITITHPSKSNILSLARKFISHPKLGSVFMINFILQFFYAWMVIYSPIYLHEIVGIPWDTLGILFTIMLAAFVIFEYPIGKMADRFGEKRFMILGLVIMGIATMFVARAPLMTIPLLALVLFITRAGASMIEVSTESYFFKHVHPDDTGTIGFFRNTYPFAYIIAPILASPIIKFLPMWTLFIILGFICLAGILFTRKVK